MTVVTIPPTKKDLKFEDILEGIAKVNIRDIEDDEVTTTRATPFVKWVGGKRSIMPTLLQYIPKDIHNYFEPFLGGGALFFELHDKVNKCYLSDINFDLVMCYNVIKKNPSELIQALMEHQAQHDEEYYYLTRALNELQDPVQIAARFLYLNKTCYNGLHRVNKKGHFNVPIGSYKNPNIVQEDNIMLCNKALKNTIIRYQPFTKINAEAGDFVYFDPPYHPTNEASFTKYTNDGFTEKDQLDLRNFVLELTKKKVKVMVSNSDTKFIRDIYTHKSLNIHTIEAPRYVNCKPLQRGAVKETLITNY